MAILWEEWLGSSEDWGKSSYAISLKRVHSFERTGARRWMTYRQLCEKYGDSALADAIVESKKNSAQLARDHIKPHPDAPEVEVTRPFKLDQPLL